MPESEPLAFDEATHTYRLRGRIVPSVTQVIGQVLPRQWNPDTWFLTRGSALHHGCRLLDQGVLDWASVSPEILPRVLAWQQFRMDAYATVAAVEVPMFSERYWYAGTTDRVLIKGTDRDIICDLKSTIESQVRVQLAGYSLLWAEREGRKPKQAVAVELRADGKYRTLWLDEPALRVAEQTFLAALTVYGFMQANGLKPAKREWR